jgi:hypothetical protein
MKVLAIKMTPTHCKGVVYDLNDADAVLGIETGVFQNVALNAIIDNQHEQQETYHVDGSDKTELVYENPINSATSTIVKPKK